MGCSHLLPFLLFLFFILLLEKNVIDPEKIFFRKSLDQLLLDRVLAFNKHLPTTSHRVFKLVFQFFNFISYGLIILGLSLHFFNLPLKLGHLNLSNPGPVFQIDLCSVSLIQVFLELVHRLQSLLRCLPPHPPKPSTVGSPLTENCSPPLEP